MRIVKLRDPSTPKVAVDSVPRPPASETAAVSLPSLMPIIPPRMMGCSMPSRSHMGVRIATVHFL